jgi:poly-gamma-glutamate synthesis protein (capsule biosynthesis protein)
LGCLLLDGVSIYYSQRYIDMRAVSLPAILVGLTLAACASSAIAPGPTPTPTATPAATPVPTPAFLDPDEVPVLTLQDVFPLRDLSTLRLDPSRLRTLIATGDVIPARYTDVIIRQRGDDFLYPVEATREITSDADLTVVNLEAPLIEGCPYHDSGYIFCGRPGFTQALQEAGVDVVTLENNHIGNYGPQGIAETERTLAASGIDFANRDTAAVRDVRGLKFGFLAFNGLGETIDRQAMTAQIQAVRPQVDVLAVAFHWGAEYVSLPQAAPGLAEDEPVEVAHAAVDAGADLVIGNHPHWVQAVELYKGKFIAYAHGNFIFDQMWSYETRVSVIGRYTFYDDVLVRVEFIPTLIENYAQPVPMEGAEARAVLEGMKTASEELARLLTGAPTAP